MILGRPTLNKIRAIISTACLTMNFFSNDGQIAIVKVIKKKKTKEEDQLSSSSKVMLIDLDVGGR